MTQTKYLIQIICRKSYSGFKVEVGLICWTCPFNMWLFLEGCIDYFNHWLSSMESFDHWLHFPNGMAHYHNLWGIQASESSCNLPGLHNTGQELWTDRFISGIFLLSLSENFVFSLPKQHPPLHPHSRLIFSGTTSPPPYLFILLLFKISAGLET